MANSKNFILVMIIATAVGAFLPWYGDGGWTNTLSGTDFAAGIIVIVVSVISIVLLFNAKLEKYALFSIIVVSISMTYSVLLSDYFPDGLPFGKKIKLLEYGIIISLASSIIASILLYLKHKNSFGGLSQSLSGMSKSIKDMGQSIQSEVSQLTSKQEIDCPKCGAKVEADAKFCASCGTDVSMVGKCSNCQKDLEPGSKFCVHCGTKVEA